MCRTANQTMLDWLYSAQRFGVKPGLDAVARLLAACGALPCGARVIHVAGTNGKGSTCAMAEAVARRAGLRTGLFTSPHLVRFHERIRVNGEMIPDEAVERHLAVLRGLAADWESPPTFFELALALAMRYFAEEKAELIILETGMGGRLDATNAVPKNAAAITPIGLDHMQYLGDSIAAVAGEKAGIIQRGTPVVSSPQPEEAARVLDARARALDTRVRYVAEPSPWPCGLVGDHQRMNAALALAALEAAGCPLPEAAVAGGLSGVQWPGRFEEVFPGVVMDGAHNPHAARVLADTWRRVFPGRKARCLFAVSADKDVSGVAGVLAPLVEEWILPPVDSPRVSAPADTAGRLRAAGVDGARVRPAAALGEALDAVLRAPRPVLICGSFFLLGQVRALLDSKPYRPSAQ